MSTAPHTIRCPNRPVLAGPWATWRGPGRMFGPALARVTTDPAGPIKPVKADVDASPTFSRRIEVQAEPTLIVLDRGEVIAQQAGAARAPAPHRRVDQALTDGTSVTTGSPDSGGTP